MKATAYRGVDLVLPLISGVSVAFVALVFVACSETTGPEESNVGGTGAFGGDSGAPHTGGTSAAFGGGGGPNPDAAGGTGGFPLEGASWSPVPSSELSDPNCEFYQADPGTLTFPPLKWTSCGDGCEVADPSEGYSVGPAYGVSANTELGRAFVQFALGFKSGSWDTGVWRIVTLSDGVTVAALGERSRPVDGFAPCLMSSSNASSRMQQLVTVGSNAGSGMSLFGLAPSTADQAWTWALPATSTASLPPALSKIATDAALLRVGSGGVFGLLDAKSSSWTTIEAPSDSMRGGGEGDLAVWTEWASNRVRGWAPDGKGVRTLLENAPTQTCIVEPSATMIVGVVEDSAVDCGAATSVRLWFTPRSSEQLASPTLTPVLESNVWVPTVGLKTRGNFGGVVVFDGIPGSITSKNHILIVQFSTNKAWRVFPESGYIVRDAIWTFDDTWLYMGETLPGANDTWKLHRVRRLLLSKPEAWGQPL